MSESTGPADDVPHALISLVLAVVLVRHKLYEDVRLKIQGSEGDLNMLAGFIAATVPLYEYPADPAGQPRVLLRHEVEGGLFRERAKELRFIDGRAAKRNLAVNATDVGCIVSLLTDPQHSAKARSRFARRWAQEMKAQSIRLKERASELRREARRCRSLASQRLQFMPAETRAPLSRLCSFHDDGIAARSRRTEP